MDTLAARACLCRRHFSRRFKEEFGTSPAAFVERLRLNEACHRLTIRDNSVDHIAASLGFKSAATFRRAFQRQLGIMPIDYRQRVARDGEGFSRAA